MVNEMFTRARTMTTNGNSLEQVAKRISAEFHAAGYVSRNKVWASYRDEKGVPKVIQLS